MASVLAFDVGGTQLRCGWVDDSGELRVTRSAATPRSSAEDLSAGLLTVAQDVLAEAADMGFCRADEGPAAAAVAMAGTVDRAAGLMRSWPMAGFTDFDVTGGLANLLGVPVALVNDVNAAALGEADVAGCQDLAALFLGTGVGGGFVSHGRLVEGRRGMAGEAGHLPFRPGEPCPAGCDGCIEAYLGGEALARRAVAAGVAETTAGLLDAWRAGQGAAALLMGDALEAMSALVSITVNLFDPERIVVGGGLGLRCPELLEVARRTVAELPLGHGRRDIPVVPATLGEQAGLLGAGCLARSLIEA